MTLSGATFSDFFGVLGAIVFILIGLTETERMLMVCQGTRTHGRRRECGLSGVD